MSEHRYAAYVESLDHKVTMLSANQPTMNDALNAAHEYIRSHPQDWQEFDHLTVVEQIIDVPVDLVVMGA